MDTPLVFEGRCWTFGDNVPTDAIAPTHVLLQGFDAIRRHVLASLNPDFPGQVRPGDILCAGRNFGCSSGRAIAPKAIRAVGIAVVLAESFSRTFYRNGHEVGLPILEVADLRGRVSDGDLLRVHLEAGQVDNLSTGRKLRGAPPPPFLLAMLKAGGIIPLVRSGAKLPTGDPPTAP